MGFDFENLDVYKKAVNFADKVYKITNNFPESELYGIISQIRRASLSISSNIAEGNGRYNKKDYAQFLRIARGSTYECVPLLELSFRHSYIKESLYEELLADCNELAKMLNGLIGFLTGQR